jgi:hypothetical protein
MAILIGLAVILGIAAWIRFAIRAENNFYLRDNINPKTGKLELGPDDYIQ